jgi:kinesin family protein 3/17
MNAESSRSHSIFTVVIESSSLGADGDKHIKAGKLHCVRLYETPRNFVDYFGENTGAPV